MEIISVSHVDVEDKVLNPDPRVCRSVVWLYVHGFESLWKFVNQHLVGETQGVHSPSVPGHVMACTVVVSGFDSELVFDQYDHFGDHNLVPERAL